MKHASGHRTRENLLPGDEELLSRLRAGDPTVLRQLLKRYLPALRLYAERLLGGSGDPEEAVQEAFIRLWTHRERWRGDGSIRSLLYTITRNAALDELRRHRREVPLSDHLLPASRSPDPDPLACLEEEDLRRAAEEAIRRLPPRRQEIFRMVREGGLSYREVAEVLDIAPQTVANLMSLALADLRACLGPVLWGDSASRPCGLGDRRARHVSGSE
ncbi:MAG: RNA polymerase sigma factor [Longimicrobiales bacterium]